MFRNILRRMSGIVSHLRRRFQKSAGKPAASRKPAPKTQHAKGTARGARRNGHRSTTRKKTPVRVVKKS